MAEAVCLRVTIITQNSSVQMCFVVRIFLGLYKDNTAPTTNIIHKFWGVIEHIKTPAVNYMVILPKENNKELHRNSKAVQGQ